MKSEHQILLILIAATALMLLFVVFIIILTIIASREMRRYEKEIHDLKKAFLKTKK